MDNSTKTRIFYIARILFERTDYEHYLSTQQIMKILEEKYNLPTHRTTVPEDIKLLQELGMDIQCIRGTSILTIVDRVNAAINLGKQIEF